jgi:multiple sugar transport system substrate-binding protein
MSVNKLIAEKAGAMDLLPLDRENRAWTIEEFKAFALKVAEAKIPNVDVFGLHFADSNNQQYYIMFMHQAFGAIPFAVEDGKYVCTINSPEGIEGLEFYLDLYNTPGVGLPGPESQGINYMNDYWYTGKLAMLMGGNVVTLTKQKRDPRVAEVVDGILVGIPRKSADMKNIYVSSINGFSVFKSTPEKEKYSKLFSEFFITRPYFWETTLKGNPPRKGSYDPDSPLYQTSPYDRSDPEIDYALNGMAGLWTAVDYGTLCPMYKNYREVYAATMQGVFVGELTPKEGLDIVADKVNKLLDDYYEENP